MIPMRSRRHEAPGVSHALREILEVTGELERVLDGKGLDFSKPFPDPPPPAPPEPFVIWPADWDEQ